MNKGYTMGKTWVLVANAQRARCFERHDEGLALSELADFVHPQTGNPSKAGAADRSDDAGKGHGRTGHAGTQFEPHTEAHAKERGSFARQLADFLNEGVAGQRCNALVLIASSPMLGEIRPCLSGAATKALRTCVPSDLTRYQGPELKERVDHALQAP